jgi:branched-chain amino acid transport system substrate-binding protein
VRRAALLSLAVLTTALAACGDDADPVSHVKGDEVTVYASLPAHGEEAAAGRATERGMRRALAEAKGRAGGRDVKLVVLSSTRPGDEKWDPGTIEANAERAVDDAKTVAYVGELDQGGSAVSLPVTNRAGILQASPSDGLTSLTQRPPGRPRAGPERYYPEGKRSFVRLVPPDLEAAREIVARLRERGARRLAIVDGEQIADHELEGMVVALIGTGLPQVVAQVAAREADDPQQTREQAAELTEELVEAKPDAILYSGAAGPEAGALLADISTQLPGAPVWGGPALATGAGRFLSAPAESCALTAVAPSAAANARQGYNTMRVVLDAIEEGGGDRRAAIAAAREPGRRAGSIGVVEIDRRGDAVGRPVRCLPLTPR